MTAPPRSRALGPVIGRPVLDESIPMTREAEYARLGDVPGGEMGLRLATDLPEPADNGAVIRALTDRSVRGKAVLTID